LRFTWAFVYLVSSHISPSFSLVLVLGIQWLDAAWVSELEVPLPAEATKEDEKLSQEAWHHHWRVSTHHPDPWGIHGYPNDQIWLVS